MLCVCFNSTHFLILFLINELALWVNILPTTDLCCKGFLIWNFDSIRYVWAFDKYLNQVFLYGYV